MSGPSLDDAVTLPAPAPIPWRAKVQIGRARRLLVSPYTLAIPGLPPRLDGLRVLHLTDLHVTTAWHPAYDAALDYARREPFDLVLITGDFIEHKEDARPAVPNVRRFLDALPSRLGVYATLGNHDGDSLPAYVGDWPVRLLCNETLTLRDGDIKFGKVSLTSLNLVTSFLEFTLLS